MKKYFPHIPREFSAKLIKACLKTLTYSILLTSIAVNLIYQVSKKRIQETEQADFTLGIQSENKIWEDELNFWLELSYKYPDYNYSYLKLSDLYSRLNQAEESIKMMKTYKEAELES